MYTMKNRNISKSFYIHRANRHSLAVLCVAAILIFTSICTAEAFGESRNQNRYSGTVASNRDNSLAERSCEKLITLAKSDLIELLEWSMELYNQDIRDYSAILHKQERINGKLIKPQQIAFWFRERPYSILMKWQKNAVSIDKLLYVEGQENGNMFVHPTAPWSWIKSVKRKPKCKEALQGSLKTADEFGFYKNMEYLHQVFSIAQRRNALNVKYIGEKNIHDRSTVAVEIRLTDPGCKYKKILMHIDKQLALPVSLTFYNKQDQLLSSYSFEKLTINPGLSEEVFCKNKNKM